MLSCKSAVAGVATLVAISLLSAPAAKSKAPSERLVADNTDFAFDLYRQLSRHAGEAGSNLFFSPHSISAVMAMTYAGARGETAIQMASALHFSLPPPRLHAGFADLSAPLKSGRQAGQPTLVTANGLWPQAGHDLLPTYLALVKQHYGAEITPVDYREDAEAARVKINAWVERQTRRRIMDLIPAGTLGKSTRLVLANAIYFKGMWKHQFNADVTSDAMFFVADRRSVSVPLMRQERELRHGDFNDMQILELPYAGGHLSMLVLLPKARNGLAALEAKLSANALRAWRESLAQTEVIVELPRFKLESSFDLGETLSALGMRDASDATRADFSGMDGGAGALVISNVVHKAFVDVSEEGTEAAAATGVIMKATSVARPPVTFRADHPFIFMIQENASGSVLFLGRVNDPRADE